MGIQWHSCVPVTDLHVHNTDGLPCTIKESIINAVPAAATLANFPSVQLFSFLRSG
jgi:hypothetical protein